MSEMIVYQIFRNGQKMNETFTIRREAILAAAQLWKEQKGIINVAAYVSGTFVNFERTITEDGKFQ